MKFVHTHDQNFHADSVGSTLACAPFATSQVFNTRKFGIEVPDLDGLYLYETRMMIVWGFDEDGLVQCEDSYTAGDGWAGIATRPVEPEQIRPVTLADL